MANENEEKEFRAAASKAMKSRHDGIKELLDGLDDDNNSRSGRDDFEQRINDYPLSVCVRSGWQMAGEALEAAEYEILLSTGGPAERIMGDLDAFGGPADARFEYQDWGTPWHNPDPDDDGTFLRFAQQFYLGD